MPTLTTLHRFARMLLVSLLAFMTSLALAPAASASGVPEITLVCGQKYNVTSLTTGAFSYSYPSDFSSSNRSVINFEYDFDLSDEPLFFPTRTKQSRCSQ